MAKKRGKKGALGPTTRSATLREENTGRKHVDVSSILKMQHLQKLAIWAGGEVPVPPLGALFGCRLGANAQAAGVPLDPSLCLCERCETVLQPGYNCTIRMEKNATKSRPHKKLCISTQNNMVYTCHFCSHRNLKRGTPKGHVKGLLASRSRPISDPKSCSSTDVKFGNVMVDSAAKLELHKNTPERIPLKPEPISELKASSLEKDVIVKGPHIKNTRTTSLGNMGTILSEKKREVCVSGSDKQHVSVNSSVITDSGKAIGELMKWRKPPSNLKDFAENNEHESTLSISISNSPMTPSEKMGSIFSEIKRKVSLSGLDNQSASENCSVRRKSCSGLKENSGSNENQIGSPVTPLTLSERKKKVRLSESDKRVGNCSMITDSGKAGGSSKRRRKSWSSLKEIAESNEHQSTLSISSLPMPFPI